MRSVSTQTAKNKESSGGFAVDWRAWATELEDYLRNKKDYGYPSVWPHVNKFKE